MSIFVEDLIKRIQADKTVSVPVFFLNVADLEEGQDIQVIEYNITEVTHDVSGKWIMLTGRYIEVTETIVDGYIENYFINRDYPAFLAEMLNRIRDEK